MKSGPLYHGTAGVTLNLYIDFPAIRIYGMYIKGNVPAAYNRIFQLILTIHTDYPDILAKDNTEYQLRSLDIFIKYMTHQIIIKKGHIINKLIDLFLLVFIVNLFFCHNSLPSSLS